MRTFLLAAVLGLGAVAGCKSDKSATEKAESNLPTMSVDAVETALAANEITAVDCNGDKLRKKMGVIPGAVLLFDEETFVASDLPADKTRKLVFYCSGPG